MFKCSPQPKLLLFVTVVTVVLSGHGKQNELPKKPGKTRKYLGFPIGIFGYYPHLDARDRRGSLAGVPYCCSALGALGVQSLTSHPGPGS